MKYCKKCGMLLEDNMERCIGCGTDVTDKSSYTRYPEPMQEKIELEKKEAGKRNLAVLAIVLIFVVILLLVGIFVAQMYVNGLGEDRGDGSGGSIFAQRLKDSLDKSDDAEVEKPQKKRDVKDDNGAYYKYSMVKDDEGHDIFRAVYPEDLKNLEHSIDLDRESMLYPAVFSFVATNDDNTTQLTFTSPQHYQYITITGGDLSPSDIINELNGQISFYDFTTVEDYLNEIVAQAYPTAKKIEQLDEADATSPVSKEFDDIVKSYEDGADKELAGLFGLPDTTKFTHNSTYKSDKIMNYRILTKEDHAVSCKFYVPVFCERYDFEDKVSEIQGQISDCYILTVSSFEAGSDELYDWYADAFELFVNNISLSDDFFALNPGRLNKEIQVFLNSAPSSKKTFENGEYVLNTGDNVSQIFIAPEKELIFATPDQEEYPGDDYTQLDLK